MSDSLEALKSEYYRLTTYKTWPEWAKVKPEDLASAGLFYMGIEDKVRCIFCNGIIDSWEEEDVPFKEHARHFPACHFVRGDDVGNIPMSNSISSLVNCGRRFSESPKKPHHPRYISEQERMKTFNADESLSLFSKVTELAKAGFFYPGYGDSVHCFHCDVSLRDWQETDDAFVEHACWSPQCRFIREIKGTDYINQIQARHSTPFSGEACNGPSTSAVGASNHEELNVDDLMASTQAEAVLEMGYSPDIVRKAIENHIKTKGTPIETAGDLLCIVMDLSDDSDSNPNGLLEPNPNTPVSNNKDVFETSVKEVRPTTFTFDFTNQNENPKKKGSSPELLLCKICMENDIAVSFIPCGHFVTCHDCSKKVEECPMCRNRIRGTLRTFLS